MTMPDIVQPAFRVEVQPLKSNGLRHRLNERYHQITVDQFLRGAQMVIQVVVNLRLASFAQQLRQRHEAAGAEDP